MRKKRKFKGTHYSALPVEKKRSKIEQAHARKPKDKESNMEDPSELQDRIPSRRSASWKKLSGELSSSKGETNTCDERVSESETESENAPSTSTGSSHEPYFKEPQAYRLFSMRMFKKSLEEAHRCCGGKLTLNDSEYKKWGMGSIMFLKCSKCSLRTYIPNCELTDERYETVKQSGSLRPQDCFDINRRTVLAGLETSIGLEGMKTLCAILNLPSPGYSQMWSDHTKAIHRAAKEEITVKLQAARKRLREHLAKKEGREILDDEIIDVTVSYDGTWSHRGWTANYGLGFAISVDTGEVLAYQLMSKRCSRCERKPDGKCGEASCMKNHTGSSKSMETAAAMLIWQGTLEYNMRFKWMVCDGDSSAYCKVWDVYGACDVCLKYENMKKTDKTYQTWIESTEHEEWYESHERNEANCDRVHKLDCVGHVQKRMGTALRNWKQKNGVIPWASGKKPDNSSGKGKGKGKNASKTKPTESQNNNHKKQNTRCKLKDCKATHSLTDKTIDKLQEYYGKAIRRNVIDEPTDSQQANEAVEKMQKAIMAILYHCSMLPDEETRHQYCPEPTAPFPWCEFKKGQRVTHKPHFIFPDYLPYLEPVFERLGRDSLLVRCIQGLSQNQNECLNGRVWSIATKDKNHSPEIVEIAAVVACVEFNEGRSGLLSFHERIGLCISGFASKAASKRDIGRVHREEYKVQDDMRKRRIKIRQGKKQNEEENIEIEGEGGGYGAGCFNE